LSVGLKNLTIEESHQKRTVVFDQYNST
jgi:hypothetical protein